MRCACGAVNAAGSLFCAGCAMPVGAVVAVMAPQVLIQAVTLVELENGRPTGRTIALPDTAWTGTLLVGRPDLTGGVVVDVNLEAFDARAKGVSRRHAQLHYVALPTGAHSVRVADWASAHGTWVDKHRLAGGASEELQAGAELRLAELVFRVDVA